MSFKAPITDWKKWLRSMPEGDSSALGPPPPTTTYTYAPETPFLDEWVKAKHDLETAKPFVLMADAVISARFPELPTLKSGEELQITFDIDKLVVVKLNTAGIVALQELAERLRK